MSDERQEDAQTTGKRSDCASGAGRRSAPGAARERLALERFIERSLHEAYAATLRQGVPTRFQQVLDKLTASQGGGDGRAR